MAAVNHLYYDAVGAKMQCSANRKVCKGTLCCVSENADIVYQTSAIRSLSFVQRSQFEACYFVPSSSSRIRTKAREKYNMNISLNYLGHKNIFGAKRRAACLVRK